jgi:hypothetical protein
LAVFVRIVFVVVIVVFVIVVVAIAIAMPIEHRQEGGDVGSLPHPQNAVEAPDAVPELGEV